MKLSFSNPAFEDLISKEWLTTNGIGGFASGTLAGANSRRYHGLLVASLNPPTQRTVMVSKVEETISFGTQREIALSANEYADVIHPQGYKHLKSFARLPVPIFEYQVEGCILRKEVFMPYRQNAVVIRYYNAGPDLISLHCRPFFTYRDYHFLTQKNDVLNFEFQKVNHNKGHVLAYEGAVPIIMQWSGGELTLHHDWYLHQKYRRETYRGLDDVEDMCTIGSIATDLLPGQYFEMIFSVEADLDISLVQQYYDQEADRIHALANAPWTHEISTALATFQQACPFDLSAFVKDLAVASDQFIVDRRSSGGQTVIAGYHWFTDWGRDTMIAMRGLVIAQGRKELAESILRTFIQYLDQGMLPNRFPDQGEAPEYNTMDATLWLFVVVHDYLEKFGDRIFVASVFDALTEVIDWHIKGTRFGIGMTSEGLLSGGHEGLQLTWMDAKVGDHVVTPREGCPVEINALWYNALRIYQDITILLDKTNHFETDLAEKVKTSFVQHFYNGTYLYDVVVPGQSFSEDFRPNQLYALSLPYPLLHPAVSRSLLHQIAEKLVTPFGVRSLSPDHPDFVAVYKGDQWERDHAYHQGTVWTFLLGEYWLALLRNHQFADESKIEVLQEMQALVNHFYASDGIQCISEIFDGIAEGHGRGCIQQAWSVGMMVMILDKMARSGVSLQSVDRLADHQK